MDGNSYLILGIVAAAALVTVWALTHVIVTLRWKGRTLQALSEKKVEEALRKQQAESLQQQMASVRAPMGPPDTQPRRPPIHFADPIYLSASGSL